MLPAMRGGSSIGVVGDIMGSGGYKVYEEHNLRGTTIIAGEDIVPFRFLIFDPDGNYALQPGVFVFATVNIFFAEEYKVHHAGVDFDISPLHPNGMIELGIGPMKKPPVPMQELYCIQISIDAFVEGEWLYLAWICPSPFFLNF